MVLLGLSLLVVSITFLYYRRPALSLLQWFRPPRPSFAPPQIELEDVAHNQTDDNSASTSTPQETGIIASKPNPKDAEMKTPAEEEDDRKAMPPPPPPPYRRPSSPTTPRASTSTAILSPPAKIPSFSLAIPSTPVTQDQDEDEEEVDNLPPPSFPALDSAQRAQPPRLNALPLPSGAGNLMPPPSRAPRPLPNRGPPSVFPATSTSSSLFPPPTHVAPPTKPRKKVLLTAGHSPLDWARLTSSPEFQASQPPSLIRVPPSLLKMHNGRRRKLPNGEYVIAETWTVLSGKVYNITPYLPFHPGGEPELLRVGGKDGTRLFGEVHPWVNWEGMLDGCLVGIAVAEEEVKKSAPTLVTGAGMEDMD